jgi:hypothetical protein
MTETLPQAPQAPQRPPATPSALPQEEPQAPLSSSGIRHWEEGSATSGGFLFLHILAQSPCRVLPFLSLFTNVS